MPVIRSFIICSLVAMLTGNEQSRDTCLFLDSRNQAKQSKMYPTALTDFVKEKIGQDARVSVHYCPFVKNSVKYFTGRKGNDFGPMPVTCRSTYVCSSCLQLTLFFRSLQLLSEVSSMR